MTENLKPCPFCGGSAKAETDGYVIKIEHTDDCFLKLLATLTCMHENDAEIIEAWNRRQTVKARDIWPEHKGSHCEFECSVCHGWLFEVYGGSDGSEDFRYCPFCGAELEREDEQ